MPIQSSCIYSCRYLGPWHGPSEPYQRSGLASLAAREPRARAMRAQAAKFRNLHQERSFTQCARHGKLAMAARARVDRSTFLLTLAIARHSRARTHNQCMACSIAYKRSDYEVALVQRRARSLRACCPTCPRSKVLRRSRIHASHHYSKLCGLMLFLRAMEQHAVRHARTHHHAACSHARAAVHMCPHGSSLLLLNIMSAH